MFTGAISLLLVVLATLSMSAAENVHVCNVNNGKVASSLSEVSKSLNCFKDILRSSLQVSRKCGDGLEKLAEVIKEPLSENKGLTVAYGNDIKSIASATKHQLEEHIDNMATMKTDIQQTISSEISAITEEIKNWKTYCNSDRSEMEKLAAEIENMKKEAANKDKQVEQLTKLSAEQKNQLENKDKQFHQLEEELKAAKTENKEHAVKVQELNKKLEDLEKREKETTRDCNLPNATVECQKTTAEAMMDLSQQERLKELVQEFNRSKNWAALNSGLQSILNQTSEAYKQLRRIGNTEAYEWFIGLYDCKELASLLLCAGFPVNTVSPSLGDTMLHGAAHGGHLELVKLLLQHGADVNLQRFYDGHTALMWAVDRGHLEVMKLLVEAGAIVNIKRENGDTALTRASNTSMIEYLESHQQ